MNVLSFYFRLNGCVYDTIICTILIICIQNFLGKNYSGLELNFINFFILNLFYNTFFSVRVQEFDREQDLRGISPTS